MEVHSFLLFSLKMLINLKSLHFPIYIRGEFVSFAGKVAEERDAIVGGEALRAIAALCLRCAQPARKTKDACVEIIETVCTSV